ncbi:MAG: HAMP domain-containing histidine kinase [Bacteroidetes bacterium]|uniref:histidine kinase n=1 Tax=Candidatus Cryptobacteroides merdigallinarum TaxID=2840770 RepID=A0A9D9HBN7_9BACT|nr:HAMP domain-containing histidine kinase [Candidatus Cryptobacteroides merdigallinarum]
MKLLLRITLWLAVALTVLLAIWAVCFYFATIDEINDETDDSLIDYSDGLIIRKLAGVQLPSDDNGTNNTYYIKEVPEEYALSREWISFEDQEVFISSKAEFESARVLTRLFRDSEDRFFELTVAVPTFEKDDIERSILWWIVALYILMLLSVLFISVWVVSYNMRPLKAMLRWLEEYNPGKTMPPVPSDTNVTEFRHLADTIRNAAERFDVQYLEQKRFIGNASHELQTPLAACSNRIEMLLDSPDLTESQAGELIKVHRELQALITLNRTLLLLTKIENGQFPETSEINFRDLVSDSVEMFREIYPARNISVSLDIKAPFIAEANEQLAVILVRNLVKNAFIHTPPGSTVSVSMDSSGFSVSNPGDQPLDDTKIFSRFYHGHSSREGSTGLGLAIVHSVCRSYGLTVSYRFHGSRHIFSVKRRSCQ